MQAQGLIEAAEKTGNASAVILAIIVVVLVTAVVSLFVYYRYDLRQKDKIIKKKDEQLETISEKALRVAALWDARSTQNSKEHAEILKMLNGLRDFVLTCKRDGK